VKRVAILQSNYIPWKGYFDLIASVDEFILFDDMQYTRRDWRNRNLIKTPRGVAWLTIPVKVKGKFHQTIRDTETDGADWAAAHLRTLQQNYARAPYFRDVHPKVEQILAEPPGKLSVLNELLINTVCSYLGIRTRISHSWDYQLIEGKSERLVSLCQQAGATEYVSGPAARDYLDESCFAQAGINLTWFDYTGYPPYPQLFGEFIHGVTVLDLLYNCGPDAHRHMKHGH
jgi:hypothetical protein